MSFINVCCLLTNFMYIHKCYAVPHIKYHFYLYRDVMNFGITSPSKLKIENMLRVSFDNKYVVIVEKEYKSNKTNYS